MGVAPALTTENPERPARAKFLTFNATEASITAGFPYYPLLDAAQPHDCLQLSGGAIGDGMPVATGAALACPGRKGLSMFELTDPVLDWVKLAEGMGVEAVRVETNAGLISACRSAMGQSGPRLVEVVF
ncbi:thiamine pyrophosphate-dependent enzyme [Labrys miyagiensis]|uniref:thiamine pyrophosphate-dependent enzyme n=1 Tax=Labrys miyagiensis TaxID=346912 RepID=UPI0024E157C5|nr:thiamine pyrophosphate-dependent enzyme [Labrys miyagiensis]